MRIALGLALLSAACIFACGSSSNKGAAGTAGGDSSGKGGRSDAGAGNGLDGDAGEAGAPPVAVVSAAKPHAAGGLVAGGVVAHSAHFTGVFSLGAAPGGNGVLTSGSSQLRGGVLGASQN